MQTEASSVMQRITITIDDDLLLAVDELMRRRGYASRSEAMRDIVREMVERDRLAEPDTDCIGALTFVYDHETRDLARRITTAHHERHDLSIASMHVHLNHESCLEVSVLRGALSEVQGFADTVASQRGVRSAKLHVIPARIATEEHSHGDHTHRHEHVDI
jgi:CopG family transcriptional regulator, nickel-responsive regulator